MTSPRIVNVRGGKTPKNTWEIRIPHGAGTRLPASDAAAPRGEAPPRNSAGETYYGRFYGLNSPPFHITPDPSLLFATETHQQALGAIEYGIAAGKGFIVVTGEVGVGKTTMLKMCLERLDSNNSKLIYIYNSALSVAELYAAILDELDVAVRARADTGETLRALQRALLAEHEAGRQVILAVDEAQNMPEQTLENLRVLSNLETAKSKLLQIILVGQPELDVVLAKPSLRQLTQRVAVRAQIKPLSWRQSCRYIQYRSQCAGRLADRPLFSTPALWYLALTARGIPRSINIACDNALINGYGYGAQRVSLKIAMESCQALQLRSPVRSPAITVAAIVLLAAIAVPAKYFLQHYAVMPSENPGAAAAISAPRSASSPVAGPVTPPQPVASVLQVTAPSSAAPTGIGAGEAAAMPASDSAHSVTESVVASAVPSADAPLLGTVETGRPVQANDAVGQSFREWIVRRGDSLYKACWATYRQCDDRAMRAVFATNPQINPSGLIHEGQTILMPEHDLPVRSN